MTKQLLNNGYQEDIERKFWKLISQDEKTYKGEIFKRLTWAYPCGGAVEYTETINKEGKRIYRVERFELSPKSWIKEKPIAEFGSFIRREELDNTEKALETARLWRNEVTPCEVRETEKMVLFKFKTRVKPFRVKKEKATI
jgi:hypothetical protein